MRILIMAGGTGGHIFPALAVAKRLIQQGHTVHWLGTQAGMEVGIVGAQNIPLHAIGIGGLRGKNFTTKLFAPWRLGKAFLQSIKVMLDFKPEVVLGMGGYVTGPAGLAAWLLRKRLVIHEQNAIAGMTNQILARFSHKVLAGFPRSFPQQITAQLTGNPVRDDFFKLLPPAQRILRGDHSGLKVLVFGGSAGARTLNNIIPELYKTWPHKNQLIIWHQAGSKNMQDATAAYAKHGVDLHAIKLVDFIQDMPQAYAWADIVICRAGALTIAELTAAGVGSILIPYPYAVDDHQTKNAQHLVDAGAAVVIQERDLNVEKLRNTLLDIMQQPGKLQDMAQAAYSLAKPEALDLVIDNCINA